MDIITKKVFYQIYFYYKRRKKMKLSKKCQKAQTKFILKIVLLIFTISTLLFPQSLSESQRNNLEAQLKRQAGKKTIVVEFYASSNYTAQAYGRYIGAWIARNGYEIKNEEADGVGNFKITLYKPSKEELEQRRIAAEKRYKEKAKKEEQERLAKFDKNPEEGLSYGIENVDFELFKKYYYPYKEQLLKNGDTNAIGNGRIHYISKTMYYTNFIKYIEFLDKEGEILWHKVNLHDLGDTFNANALKYYISHSYIDKLCYIIKKSTGSKLLQVENRYKNILSYIYGSDYDKNHNLLNDIFKVNVYDKEGYYHLFSSDIYNKWENIISFVNLQFQNQEDALKLYDAFIYRYEKYSKWYDENIPYYKELLKASFDMRKEENFK